ncbi:hypothetical protein [Pseudomonas sp. Snoq117.2]|uniref:hypothetical protein n=1 Tax=Pseudomonas TaxID=286 RepID=UPI0008CD9620|nr:hypothetical protein [Pseudomonas sp. Snoq117.2]SEP47375.1 Nucleotidyl transferase AbiEii toxin, Type IV TA system [Pseudomonas sp. Snoq117.2]
MNVFPILKEMICKVAHALGPDLCEDMTFVGGCTTGLLLTDEFIRDQVRATDDVDLIVPVMGAIKYLELQNRLRASGFRTPHLAKQNVPICTMMLGDLRVDFMPADDSLGFTNRWYQDAIKSSSRYRLDEHTSIKLVNPVYFIATKLEAWKGRGNGKPVANRDLEDIFNLIEGREELLDEIQEAGDDVRTYIAAEIGLLFSDCPQFPEAISDQTRNDPERERLLYERMRALIGEVG